MLRDFKLSTIPMLHSMLSSKPTLITQSNNFFQPASMQFEGLTLVFKGVIWDCLNSSALLDSLRPTRKFESALKISLTQSKRAKVLAKEGSLLEVRVVRRLYKEISMH